MKEQEEKDILLLVFSKTLYQLSTSDGIVQLGTSLCTWLYASEKHQQEFGYCQAKCAALVILRTSPLNLYANHAYLHRQNKGLCQTRRTKLTEK